MNALKSFFAKPKKVEAIAVEKPERAPCFLPLEYERDGKCVGRLSVIWPDWTSDVQEIVLCDVDKRRFQDEHDLEDRIDVLHEILTARRLNPQTKETKK